MNVSEVDEMGSHNLESEMLPNGVPDGLEFFANVFLAIRGPQFAICPSIR